MMKDMHSPKHSGFTLVEMAIVLGVAGILFSGVWRLLSNGNTQMRDQATASQQTQLINAVNTYLQSGDAQTFWQGLASGAKAPLPLPTSAAPAGSGGCVAATGLICNYLPPGFSSDATSSSTTNPYGQKYNVYVAKDTTALGSVPKTYSFLILTSGGDTIPDTSGGRISSMIGGDGGFVYSNDLCTLGGTSTLTACGAYGAWQTLLSTYGAASTGGHIASRSFYSPSQSLSDLWLARVNIVGDTTHIYNTMSTGVPLLLGGSANAFYFDSTTTTTSTSGGTMYVQGGTINLGTAGSIVGTLNSGGTAIPGGSITLNGATTATGGSLLTLNGNCSNYSGATDYNAFGTCVSIMNVVNGDVNLGGNLTVGAAYSQQGLLVTSDARMKKDIHPLDTALTDILKIRPVSFTYKNTNAKSMGVIAQELEKIYPELVNSTGPQGMRSVNYDGLIAPLIGAVQELQKENDALRTQIQEQAAHQVQIDQALDKLHK